MRQVFTGARVFDGVQLLSDHGVIVENGHIVGVEKMGLTGTILQGGVLTPAFVDLQVNGGGGIMLDREADAGRIAAICATHILQGCVGVLPTLITDTADVTRSVIDAGIAAARANVSGFLGLHLEGPHLDPVRKGAHDAAFIRPMDAADMALLQRAAQALPALMVTVAPASVTLEQVRALTQAGVIISLGHAECSYDTARAYIAAGARSATHLFNAMPALTAREPGLAGAVLDSTLAAGLIADGIHVSPAMLRLVMATRPYGLYLVSDCMAFAGSDMTEMELGGRRILRRDGRLTLADGTLAGADLRLDQAIKTMVEQAKAPPALALAMATSTPAALIGMGDSLGHLVPGRRADFVHLDDDWQLAQMWWGGVKL
jgi:N-acetylglucosamine-6-phosphate deacetylase